MMGTLSEKAVEHWLGFVQSINADWDEWASSFPENARLRAIAERLSGRAPEDLKIICETSLAPAQVFGSGMENRIFPRGLFAPAWALWLKDAKAAIDAVEGTKE